MEYQGENQPYHCVVLNSLLRSATCIIAFLMIHHNMSLSAGLTKMRQNRDVRPNDGFLQQLIILELDLKIVKDEFDGESQISLATKDDLHLLPKPWNYEFFVGEVNEEEMEWKLVSMSDPCPLRLSGFSSLSDTPSCSTSISRQSYARRHHYHQESRSRSCDILEETDDELRTDVDSADDLLASGDELDDRTELPVLEKVKEIIEEPEERWRHLSISEQDEECDVQDMKSPPSTSLIQPESETDVISLVKVQSAAQWKSITKCIDLDLSEEEVIEKEHDDNKFQETTRKQLLTICWQVKPWESSKDSRLFTSLYAAGKSYLLIG